MLIDFNALERKFAYFPIICNNSFENKIVWRKYYYRESRRFFLRTYDFRRFKVKIKIYNYYNYSNDVFNY